MDFDEKDEDGANGNLGLQNPVEVVTVMKKETAEDVLSETNGVATVADVVCG